MEVGGGTRSWDAITGFMTPLLSKSCIVTLYYLLILVAKCLRKVGY